ncbi:hypothetical protein JB92DRAFT_3078494 [Gautieria morchelliformis]|nr:hypothetical protein JB92DRAFT_3078494 [Gautieria morchelliformis]
MTVRVEHGDRRPWSIVRSVYGVPATGLLHWQVCLLRRSAHERNPAPCEGVPAPCISTVDMRFFYHRYTLAL